MIVDAKEYPHLPRRCSDREDYVLVDPYYLDALEAVAKFAYAVRRVIAKWPLKKRAPIMRHASMSANLDNLVRIRKDLGLPEYEDDE